MKFNVGFDLDGVFYDFGNSVRQYLESINHPATKTPGYELEITDWHFYLDWDMTDHEFVQICHDGVDAGVIFTHGDTRVEAEETMNKLYDEGHRIIIITDRPFGKSDGRPSREATFNWLNIFRFKYHEIHFTADKASIDVDFMIDDKIQNYDDMQAETIVFLLNRPWNDVGADDRNRIDSVEDYVWIIQMASALLESSLV